MQFQFNNPAIIISIVLIGVFIFNLALFTFAKRISKKQDQHPLQTLSKTLRTYGKGEFGYSKDAEELNKLLQKVNQEKDNGAEKE